MSQLVIGLFLLIAAATGNAGSLVMYAEYDALPIIEWIGAVYVLRLIYTKAPTQWQPAAHALVWSVIAGIVLYKEKAITSSISDALHAIETATGTATQTASNGISGILNQTGNASPVTVPTASGNPLTSTTPGNASTVSVPAASGSVTQATSSPTFANALESALNSPVQSLPTTPAHSSIAPPPLPPLPPGFNGG